MTFHVQYGPQSSVFWTTQQATIWSSLSFVKPSRADYVTVCDEIYTLKKSVFRAVGVVSEDLLKTFPFIYSMFRNLIDKPNEQLLS